MEIGSIVKVKKQISECYGKHLKALEFKIITANQQQAMVEVVKNDGFSRRDPYGMQQIRTQHIDDANLHRFPELVKRVEEWTGKTIAQIQEIVKKKKKKQYSRYQNKFVNYPKYASILDYVRQEKGAIETPTAEEKTTTGKSLSYKKNELVGARYVFNIDSLEAVPA